MRDGIWCDPEHLVLEIFCRHVAQSVDFYTSLGLVVEIERPDFAMLRWGDQRLYLAEMPGLSAAPEYPRANVCLIVPDADIVWRQCIRRGLPVVEPIADRPYGLRDFCISDPDGFGVRIGHRLRPFAPEKDG